MKTDRELLELAAKAAAVPGHFVEKSPLDGYPRYSCGIGKANHLVMLWNPLECDGDALRLAVKLGIDVQFYKATVDAYRPDVGIQTELYGEDAMEATRRAILRLAAKIGELTP